MIKLLVSHLDQLSQLIYAFGFGFLFFALSLYGFQRAFFKVLIVIIPFQLIVSQYGTFNMALTFVIGISMIFNKSWMKKTDNENWPLIWPFLIIIICFIISWFQAPKVVWLNNFFYLIMLISNIFIFYMTYHFISDRQDVLSFFNLLLFCNILVILYCLVQTLIGGGPENAPFGIKELSLLRNEWGKHRITGPFNAVGITAEYLVIQIILLTYYCLYIRKYRKLTLILILFNIGLLIGTGGRGGFVSFIVSVFLFLYLSRKTIGIKRIAVIIPTFLLMLFLASYIMIKHTQFNVLYQRLENTEMQGVVPESRSGWIFVVDSILKKPLFGYGPFIFLAENNANSSNLLRGHLDFYPHNLYLFILYTVGIFGFFGYFIWAASYVIHIARSKTKLIKSDSFISELPKLGMLVFVIFLFDQMKIEFLRPNLLDYQHYISALFGMFCSLKKIEIDSVQGSGGQHATTIVPR